MKPISHVASPSQVEIEIAEYSHEDDEGEEKIKKVKVNSQKKTFWLIKSVLHMDYIFEFFTIELLDF